MSESPRIIKKYPNRRLYDTANSGYITLADVKQMVLEDLKFRVIDAKSGDDLTRTILLQIILEEEAGGAPMFSEPALANIIRFYGHAAQSFMGSYLEKNVQAFSDIQAKLAEQSKTLTPEMWAQFMNVQNPLMQTLDAIPSIDEFTVQLRDFDVAHEAKHDILFFNLIRAKSPEMPEKQSRKRTFMGKWE